MGAPYEKTLFGSILQRAQPGTDGRAWIHIIIDRYGWIGELHFGRMDNVAPDQELAAGAFDHITAVSWSVTVLRDALDSRKQGCCAVKGLKPARLHIGVNRLVRLLEGHLPSS